MCFITFLAIFQGKFSFGQFWSWDWVRPPPPSLGQNPNFCRKFVLNAPLRVSGSDQLLIAFWKNWKPADRGSPVGLVVTPGSSRPDRFSVDFRMLSIIFPLNSLLFNLLILLNLWTLSSGWCCYSCGGLLCTSRAAPQPRSQANRLRSKGNCCGTEARRVIDLFFYCQQCLLTIQNVKIQALCYVTTVYQYNTIFSSH